MSIESELQKFLKKKGYEQKTKKDGSVWTKKGSSWTWWKGHRGSEVNYHHNNTIAFNYLSGIMRDTLKQRGNSKKIIRSEQDIQFQNFLSTLPFYRKIKDNIPPPKWSEKNGIEYFSISSEVGVDVFEEIVEFIVSDGGNQQK